MLIISHRGYWKDPVEKNTPTAFERSFSLGFGTETDVRDHAGTLVIAHDMPKGDELTLDQLLEMAAVTKPLLAINIKADGLAHAVYETFQRHQYPSYFVFDMSIPDTRSHFYEHNPVFMRMSEVELSPPYLDQAAGIWLDAFEADQWRLDVLARLLYQHQMVCLVSPELHRRPHALFWKHLKDHKLDQQSTLVLCTDLPEEARSFFKDRHD